MDRTEPNRKSSSWNRRSNIRVTGEVGNDRWLKTLHQHIVGIATGFDFDTKNAIISNDLRQSCRVFWPWTVSDLTGADSGNARRISRGP